MTTTTVRRDARVRLLERALACAMALGLTVAIAAAALRLPRLVADRIAGLDRVVAAERELARLGR